MSKLYMWEKIVIGVVAVVSFVAGITTSSFVDGVMALAINTIIVFILFLIGNKIFAKKNTSQGE
jgi:hypothetical protein